MRWEEIVGQVAFSPDGETLAVVSWDVVGSSIVTLWEIGDWDQQRSFVIPGLGGHRRRVPARRRGARHHQRDRGAGRVRQRRRVVGRTALGRRDARADRRAVAPRRDRDRGSSTATLRGDRAVIGSGGGTALVWDVDVSHWEDMACDIAGRNLTRAEWAQYLPGEPYHATLPAVARSRVSRRPRPRGRIVNVGIARPPSGAFRNEGAALRASLFYLRSLGPQRDSHFSWSPRRGDHQVAAASNRRRGDRHRPVTGSAGVPRPSPPAGTGTAGGAWRRPAAIHVIRRIVRASPAFFVDLDRQLGPGSRTSWRALGDRLPRPRTTGHRRAVRRRFETLPEAVEGVAEARMVIGTGRLVRAFAVYGLLISDDFGRAHRHRDRHHLVPATAVARGPQTDHKRTANRRHPTTSGGTGRHPELGADLGRQPLTCQRNIAGSLRRSTVIMAGLR